MYSWYLPPSCQQFKTSNDYRLSDSVAFRAFPINLIYRQESWYTCVPDIVGTIVFPVQSESSVGLQNQTKPASLWSQFGGQMTRFRHVVSLPWAAIYTCTLFCYLNRRLSGLVTFILLHNFFGSGCWQRQVHWRPGSVYSMISSTGTAVILVHGAWGFA